MTMGENHHQGPGSIRKVDGIATLVSVVIPSRNRNQLLRNAIGSVLRQTHGNVEVIVVDDGSTDDTQAVVQGMGDARVRYIRHESSRGASVARNTGIRAARGAIIGFLDDDDEWLPAKAEKQLAMLRDYDAVLCCSDVVSTLQLSRRTVTTLTANDFRRSPFAVGGTGVLVAWAYVFKEIEFDEALPRCQDWDIFIRIANKYRIGYLNEPLLRYNEGPHERISNALINLPPSDLDKRLQMLNKHRAFFGPYWYRVHLCGMLLYGIRHREHRWRHLMYVTRRCGTGITLTVLFERIWQVVKSRVTKQLPLLVGAQHGR